MSAITSLLSQSNWIMLNKDLIKNVGLEEAIIIGELCSEYSYWKNRDMLKDGDWFYTTRENIKENTGLSEHKQRNAIETLKTLGILEVKLSGLPAKTYYHINESKLEEAIEKVQEQDVQKVESLAMQKVTQQEVENPDNINKNINNNTKDNNKVNGIPFTPAEPVSGNNHSKIYSTKQAEKLTDDLGGLGDKDPNLKKERPKKKTLYQKCLDAISDPVYNFDSEVQNELKDYLSFVLQPSADHKEVKGLNQWTYKLKALVKLGSDAKTQKAIIENSLQLGYYGFFAPDYYDKKKDRGNKPPVDDLILEPYRTPEEKKKEFEERAKWGTY